MNENFREIMREKREKRNMTQTKLAKSIGKSPQLICDIEAGRKSPGRDTLIAIFKVLNMSLDDIF
ncbi:DNA-binding transcriptional regulator, XRE-family HTH domain [Anaerovirgula multivorans]|uniref:DNA-binding transcriptional regulator, XRE-family HTH domain n=1 Tax=Anaerovirgula multivorans TaxID=312168 RepID=A0A238ZPX4_9FIRM|nr:helix-turn-helix transcriptional regulator [Anaerovirgula multivorans]SNR85506.1 DNA-binding transcriptional regulator, XRE-family HTH domain [Anaerovirgula multivorans]